MGLLDRLFRREPRQDETSGHADEEGVTSAWSEHDETEVEPAPEPEPAAPPVETQEVLLPSDLSLLDLRGVKATRTRIVGSSYWVSDTGRARHGGRQYVLVREPDNEWDANAVAVYGKGRKVGHLSAAKAAALAPIFDALEYDGFRVGGAPVTSKSMRLWVDLPSLPALRAFLKSRPESRGRKGAT